MGRPIDPIFKVQEIQKNRAWLKLTDTIFFFGTWLTSNFLKKHNILKVFPSINNETPDLLDDLD